jgi:hypothetical protein
MTDAQKGNDMDLSNNTTQLEDLPEDAQIEIFRAFLRGKAEKRQFIQIIGVLRQSWLTMKSTASLP